MGILNQFTSIPPATTDTINLLEKGLSATSLRSKVIANNIANVNVKNFKRGEVIFEEELKRAYSQEQAEKSDPMMKSMHPQHITSRVAQKSLATISPKIHYDTLSSVRNDGNNVDMELEVSKMIRNQFQYNLYADRIGEKFRHYNSLLRMI